GIYGYIRHPGYLAFLAMSLWCFLIIPNLITLILLIYTWVVIHGHTLEEEQKLLKIYGKAYQDYQKQVGRYLPGLKGR
ncbi:isoprenylcysteine carboxylmethyltransferase family protein, partial [candidate division KSB1 bacterium]|nr:isoprenylcysteine carboxylmethyltransferase family protein [candidate division KSB1 bacterium]